MKISTKGRYAVRFLAELACEEHELVSINALSIKLGISPKYLEQIASKLLKANIITAQRGIAGGYKLIKSASDISIAEILALTGDLPEMVPCLNSECKNKPHCKTVGLWDNLNNLIFNYLNKVSLQDLIDKKY